MNFQSYGGLKWQDVKFLGLFCVFFRKRPLTVQFSKFCSESVIATPIDVLCSNFVQFGRQEIGEIVVHYLRDKKNKISRGSPAVATARIGDRAQNLPRPALDNVLLISYKSVHFRRSYS